MPKFRITSKFKENLEDELSFLDELYSENTDLYENANEVIKSLNIQDEEFKKYTKGDKYE